MNRPLHIFATDIDVGDLIYVHTGLSTEQARVLKVTVDQKDISVISENIMTKKRYNQSYKETDFITLVPEL